MRAWLRATWRDIVSLLRKQLPNGRFTRSGVAAVAISTIAGAAGGALLSKSFDQMFGPSDPGPSYPFVFVVPPSSVVTPPPTGEVVAEAPLMELATAYHRAPRAADVAGMRRTVRALARLCADECTDFQNSPFWHGDITGHYPVRADFSVPTFQAGQVHSIEDYCSFPNRAAAWAMLAIPLRAALAAQGINPRARGAASRLAVLGETAAPVSLPQVQRQAFWIATGYISRGDFPSVGAIYAGTTSFRRGGMPRTALDRAREIVTFLNAHPRPGRELWGRTVSIVLRNGRNAAVTVVGTSVQLIGYGNYYPAQGDAPSFDAVPLPRRIVASGTDSFRLDRLLRRGVGPEATVDFPAPLNLDAGQPLRRDFQLLSDAGGFFIWRIGFRLGDGSTVWAPERCHFAFAPELEGEM